MTAPTFIGIGTEKGATTWCWSMLDDHPQVCMSQPKELNYFNCNYTKGQAWYERHFARPDLPIRGEISPRYMQDPLVCERIAQSYPSTKLLVILRNPYERALSHVAMDLQNALGGVSRVPLEAWREFAQREGKYVSRSMYHHLLKPFFGTFSQAQIAVLYYEDLQADFRAFLRSLYRSVGADEAHVPVAAESRANQTQDYRSVLLFRILRFASRCCKATPLTRWGMETLYRKTSIRERVLESLMFDAGRPRFDFQQVFGAREVERLAADIERLHSELGLIIPTCWPVSSALLANADPRPTQGGQAASLSKAA
jgi:hypothetical protein